MRIHNINNHNLSLVWAIEISNIDESKINHKFLGLIQQTEIYLQPVSRHKQVKS